MRTCAGVYLDRLDMSFALLAARWQVGCCRQHCTQRRATTYLLSVSTDPPIWEFRNHSRPMPAHMSEDAEDFVRRIMARVCLRHLHALPVLRTP